MNMKNLISLIALTLLAFPFAGCSKHSPPATTSKATDLGVVTVSDGIPIYKDLGGSRACIITPSVLTNGDVRLTITLQQTNSDGVVETLARPRVQTKSDTPVQISVGDIGVALTPHIKQ